MQTCIQSVRNSTRSKMNIYFAGSISGGRADQPLYQRIVDELKEYGTVLSEHVAKSDLKQEGWQYSCMSGIMTPPTLTPALQERISLTASFTTET